MRFARFGLLWGLIAAVGLGLWFWRSHHRVSRAAALAAACFQASSKDNWSRVETLAREWSELDPGPTAAWYWLGESLKRRRRFEEAVEAYSRLELTDPRGLDAASGRMEVLFHGLHRVEEALTFGQQALALSPALAEPQRERIYYDAMTLRRGGLIRGIRRAIEHEVDLPDHYSYLLTVDDLFYRDGPDVVGHWLAADPGNAVLQHAQLAQIAMNARAAELTSANEKTRAEHDAARDRLRLALRGAPGDPCLLAPLLISAQDRADVAAVGELLSQVPDSAADDPLFWRIRGWYSMQTGELEQARQAYQEALRIHPLSWSTRNELSNLLRLQGKSQEAAKEQRLAAEGTRLVNEIRRSGHTRQTDRKFLDAVAKYAQECGELTAANAILRRIGP